MKKGIRFTLFLLKIIKRPKCFKNPKFSGKSGKLPKTVTKELNMLDRPFVKFGYRILLKNQFRPKVDLDPFGNELDFF